jgi:hypothetical protein
MSAIAEPVRPDGAGPDRYQPLCQLAQGHRRLGYQAAAARDQVTAHREYQAALVTPRQPQPGDRPRGQEKDEPQAHDW